MKNQLYSISKYKATDSISHLGLKKRHTKTSKFSHRAQTGFTLIELMVVVALVGILITTGVSSFISTVQRSAIKAVADDIANTIATARMSALVSGSPTTVCVVSDITALTPATTCGLWTDLAAGSSNGLLGLLIFKDVDGDNTLDDTNNVIHSSSFDDRKGKAGIAVASTNTPVRFTRQGYLNSPGTTFRIVSGSASFARMPYDREVIIATNIGRICSQIAPRASSPSGIGCSQ